jgi:mannose-6-phosphate isomerase-like protein (cupin superfamily)
VSYDIVRADAAEYEERPGHEGQPPRQAADVTAAANLTDSRARFWRYPARTRGRRHQDNGQEEVFVGLRGTLTLLLGEPPERVDLQPGDIVAVHQGTPMQARNETDDDVLFFAYGAPPVTGQAEFLDDVVDAPAPS